MKWDKPNGSTQWTTCRRYCIVQANSRDWIAYRMHPTTGEEVGTRGDDAMARACCEAHETSIAERKRA